MKKSIIIVIALAVMIIVLAALSFIPNNSKRVSNQPGNNGNTQPIVMEGIQVIAPKSGQAVTSPLTISGVVNGNGWSGFEGQVGTVKLLDGNGNELAKGVLKATTEWTTLPTHFEATLQFAPPLQGSGSLVFHNENAIGDPARNNTFILPVTFQ